MQTLMDFMPLLELNLVGLLLVYGTDRSHSKSIARILSEISKEDKKALEAFFSNCISLFTKPNYSERTLLTNVIELSTCLNLQNIQVNRGLEVWRKYKHLFPSSTFSVIETQDKDYITVLIIQRQNFLKNSRRKYRCF